MTTQPNTTWEEKFDLRFRNRYFFPTQQNADEVKSFIQSLLEQDRREQRELFAAKVQKMEAHAADFTETDGDYGRGFQQVVRVLALLQDNEQ